MELNNEYFMQLAINQAKNALAINEVPIGCVITYKDDIVGTGFNQRNTARNTLYHAEIIAINEACKNIGDWRLEDCRIFVTIEPCSMCAGAILQARIKTLIFGAKNNKAGSCGSIINILNNDNFNHKTDIISGVMEKECRLLIKNFFKNLRR